MRGQHSVSCMLAVCNDRGGGRVVTRVGMDKEREHDGIRCNERRYHEA